MTRRKKKPPEGQLTLGRFFGMDEPCFHCGKPCKKVTIALRAHPELPGAYCCNCGSAYRRERGICDECKKRIEANNKRE